MKICTKSVEKECHTTYGTVNHYEEDNIALSSKPPLHEVNFVL